MTHYPLKTLLAITLLLAVASGNSHTQPKKPRPGALAADLFAKLGVQEVACPAYTFEGGNLPVCGHTGMTAEAFTQAFSRTAKGRLEPLSAWREEHTVWFRYYRYQGVRYAAIYTPLPEIFNVQLVRLEQ